MSDLISEVHVTDDELYACINNYNVCDFLKLIKTSLLDEDGIDAILRDGYMVIPDFQDLLEAQFDMSLEEAKEYFNL